MASVGSTTSTSAGYKTSEVTLHTPKTPIGPESVLPLQEEVVPQVSLDTRRHYINALSQNTDAICKSFFAKNKDLRQNIETLTKTVTSTYKEFAEKASTNLRINNIDAEKVKVEQQAAEWHRYHEEYEKINELMRNTTRDQAFFAPMVRNNIQWTRIESHSSLFAIIVASDDSNFIAHKIVTTHLEHLQKFKEDIKAVLNLCERDVNVLYWTVIGNNGIPWGYVSYFGINPFGNNMPAKFPNPAAEKSKQAAKSKSESFSGSSPSSISSTTPSITSGSSPSSISSTTPSITSSSSPSSISSTTPSITSGSSPSSISSTTPSITSDSSLSSSSSSTPSIPIDSSLSSSSSSTPSIPIDSSLSSSSSSTPSIPIDSLSSLSITSSNTLVPDIEKGLFSELYVLENEESIRSKEELEAPFVASSSSSFSTTSFSSSSDSAEPNSPSLTTVMKNSTVTGGPPILELTGTGRTSTLKKAREPTLSSTNIPPKPSSDKPKNVKIKDQT
ncbi:MAG TPA: hypothetical protein VGJ00_06580 [Rhabdochlamydiaceae bacterium]